MASEAYYRTEWTAGAWMRAKAGAELAAELLGRSGEPWRTRTFEARMVAAAAGYIGTRTQEDYEKMLRVHDDIVDMIDSTTDAQAREAGADLMYQSRAWSLAMAAAFRRSTSLSSRIPRGIKKREFKTPKTLNLSASEDSNVCIGRVETKALKYPSSAMFSGMAGAVLIEFDFDKTGAAASYEVKAAVPARHFADSVETAAPSVRLVRREDDEPGCALDAQDRILHIIFQIQ